MADEKKFRGKILTTLYPSESGKTTRSYTLGPYESKTTKKKGDSYSDFLAKLEAAGPGCKLSIKEAPEAFAPARYILEVLTAAELAEERDSFKSSGGI